MGALQVPVLEALVLGQGRHVGGPEPVVHIAEQPERRSLLFSDLVVNSRNMLVAIRVVRPVEADSSQHRAVASRVDNVRIGNQGLQVVRSDMVPAAHGNEGVGKGPPGVRVIRGVAGLGEVGSALEIRRDIVEECLSLSCPRPFEGIEEKGAVLGDRAA